MASFSRLELVNKFKKEILDWEARGNILGNRPMDSTHIQMASVDEMMSAYGYAPRRLPNYPDVLDGRFGYYSIVENKGGRKLFMSFEAAVRMHNGSSGGFYTNSLQRRLKSSIVFARGNRIVEQVSLQRIKKGGLAAQTKWVKFCGEEE